jgi:hypothetical protein
MLIPLLELDRQWHIDMHAQKQERKDLEINNNVDSAVERAKMYYSDH